MAEAAATGEWVRIDMHVHTRRSFDCLSDGDAVVARAIERGVDRLCVTDHNEIDEALRLKDRYPDRIIVGEEVKTAEGVDIIGLYITERIPKGTPALETCERIRDQGGIVYVPHPFAGGKGGGAQVLEQVGHLVDAVEGFNGRIHFAALNERAVAWGRAHGVAIGAGSDAHTLREVGRTYVEVPPFRDEPVSFLAALREARIRGHYSSWAVHLASTYAKLHKRWAA